MSYTENFLKIIDECGCDRKSILDFKALPDHTVTKSYADFIYKNVYKEDSPFQIYPFELFLLKEDEPNAFAIKYKELYTIIIHLSLFSKIESKLLEYSPKLDETASNMLDNSAELTELSREFLIYQFVSFFVYYHELAHLNQYKQKGEIEKAVEKYELVEGKEFDKEAHAMEIDADLFAAQQITHHLLQYWNDSPLKSKENLEEFIAVVATSIFLLFFELNGGWGEMYFLEFDHLHILIRVSYIVDCITNIAELEISEDNLKPSKEVSISNSLFLTQQFLTSDKKSGLQDYIKMYMENIDGIGDYIHNEMSPYSKTLPYLISNWGTFG